jgi:hypothetical protein
MSTYIITVLLINLCINLFSFQHRTSDEVDDDSMNRSADPTPIMSKADKPSSSSDSPPSGGAGNAEPGKLATWFSSIKTAVKTTDAPTTRDSVSPSVSLGAVKVVRAPAPGAGLKYEPVRGYNFENPRSAPVIQKPPPARAGSASIALTPDTANPLHAQLSKPLPRPTQKEKSPIRYSKISAMSKEMNI